MSSRDKIIIEQLKSRIASLGLPVERDFTTDELFTMYTTWSVGAEKISIQILYAFRYDFVRFHASFFQPGKLNDVYLIPNLLCLMNSHLHTCHYKMHYHPYNVSLVAHIFVTGESLDESNFDLIFKEFTNYGCAVSPFLKRSFKAGEEIEKSFWSSIDTTKRTLFDELEKHKRKTFKSK